MKGPNGRDHAYRIWDIQDLFFKRCYLFIFRERGMEGEREGEKQQCVVASCKSPTGDLAQNPGMCPYKKPNWQPFASQASNQSTESYQPGQDIQDLNANISQNS